MGNFIRHESFRDWISRDIAKKLVHFSTLKKLRIHEGESAVSVTNKMFVNLAQGLKKVPRLKELDLDLHS